MAVSLITICNVSITVMLVCMTCRASNAQTDIMVKLLSNQMDLFLQQNGLVNDIEQLTDNLNEEISARLMLSETVITQQSEIEKIKAHLLNEHDRNKFLLHNNNLLATEFKRLQKAIKQEKIERYVLATDFKQLNNTIGDCCLSASVKTPTVPHINDCLNHPCQHGGTCHDVVNWFTCTCASGYTDHQCQTVIDHCARNPCQHGTCKSSLSGYTCKCAAGYKGDKCDIIINHCARNPCHHGTCTSTLSGFSCNCAAGYTGKTCGSDINDCLNRPCQHGGSCHDVLNGFTCTCASGYTDHQCQTVIDHCAHNPCQHGTCKSSLSGYTCKCTAGYKGDKCDITINHCTHNPCHQGTCKNGLTGFSCECLAGYTGKACEINMPSLQFDHQLAGRDIRVSTDGKRMAIASQAKLLGDYYPATNIKGLSIWPCDRYVVGNRRMTTGRLYWEIEVAHAAGGMCRFQVGVTSSARPEDCNYAASWGVILYCNDATTYITMWHAGQELHTEERVNTSGHLTDRYGLLLDVDARSLSVIDVKSSRIMYTFTNVDTSRGVTPLFYDFGYKCTLRLVDPDDVRASVTIF